MIISAGKSTEGAGLRIERGPGFPHWTAGFFLGGLTEIVCGGRTWELPGHHAVILAPHTPYEARVAGLSISRFSCLFKERTGLAPVKFLESRRIEKARHLLLTTDLPVQQIGWQVGFPNAQHFSTRFRKLTGQSPLAFRRAPRRRFGELNPQLPD